VQCSVKLSVIIQHLINALLMVSTIESTGNQRTAYISSALTERSFTQYCFSILKAIQ